jgi:hypothetical protein
MLFLLILCFKVIITEPSGSIILKCRFLYYICTRLQPTWQRSGTIWPRVCLCTCLCVIVSHSAEWCCRLALCQLESVPCALASRLPVSLATVHVLEQMTKYIETITDQRCISVILTNWLTIITGCSWYFKISYWNENLPSWIPKVSLPYWLDPILKHFSSYPHTYISSIRF